jgi:hypothetical protein
LTQFAENAGGLFGGFKLPGMGGAPRPTTAAPAPPPQTRQSTVQKSTGNKTTAKKATAKKPATSKKRAAKKPAAKRAAAKKSTGARPR